MKIYHSILLAAIVFSAFVSPRVTANSVSSRHMNEKELIAMKARLKRSDVANAWVLTGYESFDLRTRCLLQRTLYVYSKPIVLQAKVLVANVTELLFKATKKTAAGCAELVLKKEIHRRVGKYIDKNSGNEIISAHDSNGFFDIRGHVNEEQLISLKKVIDAISTCSFHNRNCDAINLNIGLSEDATRKLDKVLTENIRSVEGQVSPDGNGPFIVLFRPYDANDLIVFISGLMTSRPTVQITYIMQ